jgi:hypothetical protein
VKTALSARLELAEAGRADDAFESLRDDREFRQLVD